MDDDIIKYISTCDTCQRTKTLNQKPAGLLQPLPLPEKPWQQITMDLIPALPENKNGYDCIITFVDRLTKMATFTPCKTAIDAPGVMRIFRRDIFRLHGLPTVIVSDRDTRFTSSFWKAVMDALGTKLAMSTSRHPQTDGQSERANRTIEQILRAYTNERADDWDEHLDLAEFAYNNTVNPTTGFSPFYLNSGRHPETPVTLARLLRSDYEPNLPAAVDFLEHLDNCLLAARSHITRAQAAQKHYADKKRRDVAFSVGDEVLISTRDLPWKDRNKFRHEFIGPFRVVAKSSPVNYELKLNRRMTIHNKFHVSQLRPYNTTDDYPGRVRYSSDDILADLEGPIKNEHVAAVNGKRWRVYGRGGQWQYLVKWSGRPDHEKSWESEKRLLPHCQQLLDSYNQRNAGSDESIAS